MDIISWHKNYLKIRKREKKKKENQQHYKTENKQKKNDKVQIKANKMKPKVISDTESPVKYKLEFKSLFQ